MNLLKRPLSRCLYFQKQNTWLNRSVLIIYAAIVLWLSLKPTVDIASPLYNDKIAHCLTYALFTALMWRISHHRSVFIGGVICVLLFSTIIEIIQPYTGRLFSWGDIAANVLGVSLMSLYLSRLSFAKAL
ncbi:VanZ family protein [Eionea flava]